MAVYSVSSSGNLKFADTGLGNPVSFFAYQGLTTSAIASAPITGQRSVVWIVPPPYSFTSQGTLKLSGYLLRAQDGFPASSIGESSLTGGFEFQPSIFTTKGFVSGVAQSSGNLRLTGSSVVVEAFNRTSSGQLTLSGSTTSQSLRKALSAGNLRLTGNTLARSINIETSSGSLVVTKSSSYQVLNVISTTGNLTTSGSNVTYKRYNKFTLGSLSTTGDVSNQLTLQPTSNGLLEISTYRYDPINTGGISTTAIAGELDNLPATLRTTVISFFGSNISSGQLIITPTGEIVADLGNTSPIAGSALADSALAGGMDTIRRASTYTTVYSPTSLGLLHIQGPSTAIQYDNDTVGSLVLSGATIPAFIRGFLTSGSLETVNSSIGVRTLGFDSAGNIVLPDTNGFTNASVSDSSSIAGSPIASIPVGGSSDYFETYRWSKTLGYNSNDGNLDTTGDHSYSKTLDFLSSGQLNVIGITGSGQQNLIDSAGNLVVSGNNITVRTLNFDTSGSTTLVDVSGYQISELGNSSGIAGSAIAVQPIGSGIDSYKGFDFVRNLGFDSSGALTIDGIDGYVRILDFLSEGYMTFAGIETFQNIGQPQSSGSLTISGTSVTPFTLNFDSSGNLLLPTVSEINIRELGDSSGIAGSAIAVQPIGYGIDSYKGFDFVRNLGFDSSGNLVVAGEIEYNKTLDFLSEGYLTIIGITGSGQQNLIDSAGDLFISGNSVTSRTLNFYSSGYTSLTPYGISYNELTPTIASGAIADPGSSEYNTVYTALSTARETVGELVLPTSSTVVRTLGFTSSGNIVLNGSNFLEKTWGEQTYGSLHLTGTLTFNRTWAIESNGTELLTDKTTLVTQNSLAASALGEYPISGGIDNIPATFVQYAKGSVGLTSTGLLTITGQNNTIFSSEEKSSGQIIVFGTSQHITIYKPISAGNLKLNLTSTNVYGIKPRSAGNLVLRSNVLGARIILQELSSGSLAIAGSAGMNRGYNKSTAGLLNIITGSISRIKIVETTAGKLAFADHWYARIAKGSGIAVNGIAASPIAGAEESTFGTLRQTVVNYVGPRVSSGNLKLSAVGTRIVTDTSSLASGAIATTSLAGSNTSGNLTARVRYISQGVAYSDNVFYSTSTGTLGTIGGDHQLFVINGESFTEQQFLRVTSGRLKLSGASVHTVVKSRITAGRLRINGTTGVEQSIVGENTSHGQLLLTGSSYKNSTYAKDTAGSASIRTESKYNIIAIVSSIGSAGVIGGVETSIGSGESTSGRVKLSGQTDIVISIKPGSRGFTRLTGSSVVKEELNKEHMGGSGIYYGPWGAPFVLPFAKEWEEVNGKRRRVVRKLAVAVRFSRGQKWQRTAYDLNKLPKDVKVSVSQFRNIDIEPTSLSVTATSPKFVHRDKPSITVNTNTMKLLKDKLPNVDLSNLTVKESSKVKVKDIINKPTLVETGSITPVNYNINATVEVDTTSFQVTVKLPDKVDA